MGEPFKVSYSTRSTNEPEFWPRLFYRLRLKSWFISEVCFVNALLWPWCQSIVESLFFYPLLYHQMKHFYPIQWSLQWLQWYIISHSVFLLSKNIFCWNRRERNLISLSIKQPIICWANWLCFSRNVTDSKMNLMRTCVRKCGSVCWCHSSSCAVWSQRLFGCCHNRNVQRKRCTNLTETWILSFLLLVRSLHNRNVFKHSCSKFIFIFFKKLTFIQKECITLIKYDSKDFINPI